jgi:hypothetical protein
VVEEDCGGEEEEELIGGEVVEGGIKSPQST